jgi:acetyl-CoA/propionyl-CoA carboxylase, biotin carboxylase, biotin carboxyl carrier protein
MALFSKVLVANRGEIAIRVFRTLHELGIGSVAVYSDADRSARHAAYADEAFAVESYLDAGQLVTAALRAGAEAVHPGYGFLAENAGFARACEEAGLVWVGPPAEAIELMGRKTAAREAMWAAGVPIVPGATDPVSSAEEVVRLGAELGYPLIVKAVAGGGGKGMKLVASAAEADAAFESARREGQSYFANAEVYVERYLEDPRHIEVQVLADGQGNVIHLGERDCTIQRRHQKLIEETPSPAVGEELRAQIGQIAVDAARAAGYRSAGTIEGLLSADGDYYFMEMNTRIQVEHTVTEAVTGIDLIREQLRIAAGEPLSIRQEDMRFSGHAIECRINAEDVAAGFLPSPGTITVYREPAGPGVRVDSGVVSGSEISPLYDPMIAKVIVHDVDREHARRRMLRALDEFELGGVKTLLGFHRALLRHPCFIAGATCHGIVESEELAAAAAELERAPGGEHAAPNGRVRERVTQVEVDGRRFDVKVLEPEPPWVELARRRAERRRSHRGGADEEVVTPMQGTVIAVKVAAGDEVSAGQVLCVIEAMKMENEIVAHRDGVVSALAVAEGQAVRSGDVICVVTAPV